MSFSSWEEFTGPGCGFYTASHPLLFAERNTGLEKASPITIEDNVWLGGNVVLLPGVTIHEGAVVGAGAVVSSSRREAGLSPR